MELKERVFNVLSVPSYSTASRIFAVFILVLISLNVFASIIGTVEGIAAQYEFFLTSFEVFSVFVFTVEYIFRLWSCTVDKQFSSSVSGRIRFALTPLILVDLIAILPFYLPLAFAFDARFVRIFRLFRFFRLFKTARYHSSFTTVWNVVQSKKYDLGMSFFLLLVALLFASSLMYYVEHDAQPKTFASIPHAMWWGIATMATIGYGDIVPVTPLGKFLGGFVAVFAIAFFALPAGVIVSGFMEQVQNKKNARRVCPHCRRKLSV